MCSSVNSPVTSPLRRHTNKQISKASWRHQSDSLELAERVGGMGSKENETSGAVDGTTLITSLCPFLSQSGDNQKCTSQVEDIRASRYSRLFSSSSLNVCGIPSLGRFHTSLCLLACSLLQLLCHSFISRLLSKFN